MLHKLIYIQLRPLERQCPNTIQAYYRAIIHTFEAYQEALSKEYKKMVKMLAQGLHHDHGITVVAKLGRVIISD